MRTGSIMFLAALSLAAPATAQVSVDPRALDGLQTPVKPAPRPATPSAPNAAPAARPPVQPAPVRPQAQPAPAKPPAAAPAATQSGTTIRPNATPPAVPTTPPPLPVIPPPLAVPTRPAPPALPAPVAADAPGLAVPLPGGLRVTFGAGRTDLNPSTEATIRTLVRGGPGIAAAPENASYTITSYAAGTPEDPSTARRLSLSRALAARSVLISQGVASVRIYVKALGPASPGFADGPADRADVIVGPPVLPVTASNGSPPPPKKP